MAYQGKESSSSELRHDWLSDRWVIFAPQRNERPDDFADYRPRIVVDGSACPFCLGHESETPPAVAVYSSLDAQPHTTAKWQVRVVPNKFPAVNGVNSLRWHPVGNVLSSDVFTKPATPHDVRPSHGTERVRAGFDLYNRRQVTGAHEVIIESSQHLQSITQMDAEAVELIFRAYRDRLRYWARCGEIAYAVLFKNVGSEAGASLVHSHSQLIATNILPTDVQRSLERLELFHRTQNVCLFCRMISEEVSEKARIVAASKNFLAFCPFASRFPSQVTVVPRKHCSAFEDLPDQWLGELGRLMHTIVQSIETCYPDTSYNYIIHSAPSAISSTEVFHWRVEVFPRLTKVAGFEWGSDCYINPLSPEVAAQTSKPHWLKCLCLRGIRSPKSMLPYLGEFRNMRLILSAILAVTICSPATLVAQEKTSALHVTKATNWHQWRGPNFDGSSSTANPPTQWSDTKNILWKVEIPGTGSASPIVWENKIFIATAIETNRTGNSTVSTKEKQRSEAPAASSGGRGGALAEPAPTNAYQYVLLCLDRATGKELWRRVAVEQVPHEGKHGTNTFASGSPTTDGQLVYVSFGSRGIYCYDLAGNPVWQRDLGDMQTRNGFGEGSSPTLHGDSLVVMWDHEGPSFIEVLNAKTGQSRWKKQRDEVTTWFTPLVVEYAQRTQIITNGTKRSRSYDLATGELLWECGGQFTNPVPSPILVNDQAICMTGYRGYAIYSIPLSSKGDLTGTDRIKWKRNDAAPYVSSAALYGGQLYFTKSRDAIFSIIDANTGESIVDQERLPKINSLFYASPVAATERIYFTGRDGTTIVIRHGKLLDVIATNELNEGVDASPALVGNQMFIRGEKHLYCVQETELAP